MYARYPGLEKVAIEFSNIAALSEEIALRLLRFGCWEVFVR